MKKLLQAIAAFLLLPCFNFQLSILHAQGTAFTYQGRLNNNGTNTTGIYDVKFMLFATNTTGTAIAGPVTNVATGVSNGLFTVAVDFGSVFNGASNWLELAVRSNGVATFITLAPRQQLTPVPYAIYATTASNLSGTVTAAQLPASVVTNNATGLNLSGSFTGNGTSVTNVNAATLGGISSTGYWKTNGNAGANPTNGAFLGSTDNLPLEFKVNGVRALRLEPNATSANVIGGFSGNVVSNGIVGGFVVGGGFSGVESNRVAGNFASVLGGSGNVASGQWSTAMGRFSTASGDSATAFGNVANASGPQSVAMGDHVTAIGQHSAAIGDNATASAFDSTAIGESVTAGGQYSTAMGYHAQANHDGAFVWADSSSTTPFSSSAINQFLIRATGGVGINTNNPGTNALLVNGTVAANNFSGTFSGNGAGVTNVGLGTLNSGGALAWGDFTLMSSPSVGSSPQSVTAADVNGDGKLDLISANTGANTLTVLTNNGSGGFVVSSSPSVGSSPQSVTAADVNGDGKPDLISANAGANTLTVLTNNGSGGFAVSSSPSVGSSPQSVTAADVNGDGKPDLISANAGANTLTVLTNNGSGGFVLSSSPSVGSSPVSVTAADVNGDGKPDLISANNGSFTLTVLTNNGSGGFAVSSSPSVGVEPYSVTAADVNGDGKPDLISANNGSSTLTVLTNNGSGGFTVSSSPSAGSSPVSVTAVDVNGDGKLDLINANSSDTVLTVLTNNGSGGFAVSSSPSVGSSSYSVVAADVNGDGKPDLISANKSLSTLTVFFNTPSFKGVFVGDGSGLAGLSATSLTGTIAAAQLPASVVTNNGTGLNLSGSFSGNGSGLTGLSATSLTGTISDARLSANVALRSGGNAFNGQQTVTGGNVGIGTTTPTENLTIAGVTNFNSGLKVTGNTTNGTGLVIENTSSGGHKYDIISSGANSSQGVGAFVVFDETAHLTEPPLSQASWRLTIATNGNVGLGTTTPASKLDVQGSADFTGNVGIGTTNPISSILYPGGWDGLHIRSASGNGLEIIQGSTSARLHLRTDSNVTNYSQDFVIANGANKVDFMWLGAGLGNRLIAMTIATNGNLTVAGTVTANSVLLTSDRNAKENFAPILPASVLAKVAALPITEWNYKQDPAARHFGPMAQDFQNAFGLNGGDDKHISVVDENGVALAAIQGLNQKLEEQKAENAELKARLEKLERLLQK